MPQKEPITEHMNDHSYERSFICSVFATPEVILAISQTPPSFSIEEDNVVVYLAGYLGKKSLKICVVTVKLCGGSLLNLQVNDPVVASHLSKTISMTSFVSILESMFQQYVPSAVHGTKVRAKFLSKAYEAEHLCHITCDNVTFLPARLYMMQLYFVVS